MEQERRSATFDPAAYSAFIRQIELRQIWLHQARVENVHGAATPESTNIDIASRARWTAASDGFRIFHSYVLKFEDENKRLHAEIELEFGVEYSSNEPLTDEFFGVFREVNLPVNTWPFLREYVSSTLGRMGWTPVTLPAFKIGPGQERPQPHAGAPSPQTKRRRTKKADA